MIKFLFIAIPYQQLNTVVGVEIDEVDGGDAGAEALQDEVAEPGTDPRRVPQASDLRRRRRIPLGMGEAAGETVGQRGAGERLAGHGVQVAVRRVVRRDADEISGFLTVFC